jgi:3-dehydroquinate synthase
MEKIKNEVCDILIADSYDYFKLEKKYDSILIITDEKVYKYQMNKFIKNICGSVFEYIVKEGEESKSFNEYEQIIKYCIRINLSRKSAIIALGGGVVGDLAGFIASTYMRGIDLIQIPTTLLSQVDSSVGGKTALNIGNFKNIIGTFYQPTFTYINISSLNTLSEDDFLDGLSEVIKYGVIYDYEFLKYLNENSEKILNKDVDELSYVVSKCVKIKAEIVQKDEKELNLRKILNFGHTFAHGIEKLKNISHGKAVLIGMNMAFNLALEENLISKDYYEEFLSVCKKYNMNLKCSNVDEKEVLEIMKLDKKNSFKNINLVLPINFSKVEVINNISEEKILGAIKRCIDA